MLSNKDISFNDEKQILNINGDDHSVKGDPAIKEDINKLYENDEELEANYQSAAERITALEQQGGGLKVIKWDYTMEPTLLPLGKKYLLIAKNTFSSSAECGIVYFDDDGVNIYQDGGYNIGIVKKSNGWDIQKQGGTAGKCIILQF